MPEICPSLLTHRLVPSISTGQPNGNISYGTVLAEMEQAMADDGTGGVGQLA
jgi:hypothetical protein